MAAGRDAVPQLDTRGPGRCADDVEKPFLPLAVLAVVAAALGCGGSVSDAGAPNGDAGTNDATSSSSGSSGSSGSSSGESGNESGSGSVDSSGSDSNGDSDTGSGSSSGTDAGQTPPSCAPTGPGMTNCGPRSSATESCCTSLEVPGGTYDRTYDNDGEPTAEGGVDLALDGGPTGEADPATVSAFRLDKYDVTVGRFRQFVNGWNGGWTPGEGSGKHSHLNGGLGLVDIGAPPDAGTVYETGWVTTDDSNIAPTNANLACNGAYQTWTNTASTQENLPMNCVNWYEAYAFCIWDGGFLPSEAEWEFAAAGGSQQRAYPWGSTDPGTANLYAIFGCDYGGAGETCSGVANIAPVGTAALGAGLWGQLDLAGSMWQWNLDWWASAYSGCTDCADLTAPASCAAPPCSAGGPSFRVFRGGAFNYGVSTLTPPTRQGNPPMTRNQTLGFRCARSP